MVRAWLGLGTAVEDVYFRAAWAPRDAFMKTQFKHGVVKKHPASSGECHSW